MLIEGGAIHRGAGDVVLLAKHVHPTVLIAPGEAGVEPPLGQVVEHGQFLGGPDGIPGRENQPQRRKLDALGSRREVGV